LADTPLVFGINTKEAKDCDADRAKEPLPIPELARFKDQVQSILNAVTTPAVRGIRLEAVEDAKGSDKGILAILVPPSIGGPHRANMGSTGIRDHYFQRSASRSDIMPHSLLAALMGRVPSADLYLAMGLRMDATTQKVAVSFELGNAGRGAARQPAVKLFELEEESMFWMSTFESAQITTGWNPNWNPAQLNRRATLFVSSSHDTVVYPGDRVNLTENGPMTLRGNWHYFRPIDFLAKGVLYAADAPPVEFERRIKVMATDTLVTRYLPLRDDLTETS